ncbi:MAG: hypothetical protein ACREHE_06110 [Rhizomicrobium sp.]
MHIAIAITLFFAAATSALGLPRALARIRFGGVTPASARLAIIATGMTLWFSFAGSWMLVRH